MKDIYGRELEEPKEECPVEKLYSVYSDQAVFCGEYHKRIQITSMPMPPGGTSSDMMGLAFAVGFGVGFGAGN